MLLSGAKGGEIVEEGALLLLAAPARGYPGDGEHAGDEQRPESTRHPQYSRSNGSGVARRATNTSRFCLPRGRIG